MKSGKYNWIAALKEVLKELFVLVIFLGVGGVALIIGALLPKSFLAELPFEFLLFLAALVILAILYIIAAIVTIVSKTKLKIRANSKKEE